MATLLNQIANAITPTTIDDFKSMVNRHQGMARPNRFAIMMSPPQQSLLNLDLQGTITSALSGTFSIGSLINDPRDISLLCEACSFPARQITTLDYQSVRQSIKIPNGYLNEDITLDFHLTNDYYIKKIFDRWSGLVIDIPKYRARYDNEYCSDVVIQQLNQQNLPVYGIRLKRAWPVSVLAITLDNSSTDSTMKLSVTFTYEDFEPEGSIKTLASGVSNMIGGITKLL